MSEPVAVRNIHSLDVGAGRLGRKVTLWSHLALAVVISTIVAVVGAVRTHESSLTITGSLLCAPIAVAGLAGLWWGVLLLCPTGLLIDLMRRSE